MTAAVTKMSNVGSRMIMPRWWTGTAPVQPAAISVDARPHQSALKDNPAKPPDQLREQMLRVYDRLGVVVLRNSGLEDDLAAMSSLARVVMGGHMKYEAGANPRSSIGENVFDVGAPETAHLHYHHEMAYTADTVESLGFCCQTAIPDGSGATYLSENIGATDEILRLDVGRKLRDKGITYIRCLTDRSATRTQSGVYNHWQKSFGTEDAEEAKAIANSKGLHVEFGPGRYMRTSYTVSAFEYHGHTDRNLLFSSVADDGMWFDTWPGVMQLPHLMSFASATPAQRPLKITYGDGTQLTEEELRDYVEIYDRHGFPLSWRAGDIAVVCNFRYAHGRPAFTSLGNAKRSIGFLFPPNPTEILVEDACLTTCCGFDIASLRLDESKVTSVTGVILGPKYRRQGHLPNKW